MQKKSLQRKKRQNYFAISQKTLNFAADNLINNSHLKVLLPIETDFTS